MCSRVKCRSCGKVSWSGCGAHVDAVMRGVPESERCRCRETGVQPPAHQRPAWWPFR